MAKYLNARIMSKHDTEENWNSAEAATFVPKNGEIIIYESNPTQTSIYEKDFYPRIKIGDGKTTVAGLEFITDLYQPRKSGYGLSQHNYSPTHYNFVKKLIDLGIEDPKLTDTLYTAGNGIGLSGTKFYNKGLINIDIYEVDDDSGSWVLSFDKGNGVNGSNYTTFPVTFGFLAKFSKKEFGNYLSISSGSNKGTFSILGNDVYITGLKELAYLTIKDLVAELEKNYGYGSTGGNFTGVTNIYNKENEYNKIFFKTSTGSETSVITAPTIISREVSEGAYFKIQYNDNTQSTIYTNALSLDGGTIKGSLTTQGVLKAQSNIYLWNTSLTKGTAPESSSSSRIIYITDKTGNYNAEHRLGMIYNYVNTSNINYLQMHVYRPKTGSTENASFYIRYSEDGEAAAGTSSGVPFYSDKVYGAVYNDYAEFRASDLENPPKPGQVVYSDSNGIIHPTISKLQFFEGVVSDTFGFAIGETEKAKTPIAVAGRVLVYTDEQLCVGNAVCAGPDGKVCKMTREEISKYPDRIVGIVSEIPTYKYWGENNIEVNNRVWIRIK